jgi:glycosyltransferase involved in cell wall biosynthesis
MNIWIVTIYEPLPFGDAKTRPQRCGMLAKELLERGHTVELWTSAFDHVSHRHYHEDSLLEKASERFSIQFIKGCGYPNDHSLKRFFHNRQTGREFYNLSSNRNDEPAIIFAPVPILELAESAVYYANKRNIPVIVDVRDLWPDVYLTMVPKPFHFFAKLVLSSEYRRARYIFSKATGITAVSKAYLNRGLSHAGRVLQDADHVFPLGAHYFNNSSFEHNKNISDIISKHLANFRNKFIVTFIGTFSKFLDIQNVLEAAKLLSGMKDIQIFIVGSGEQSQDYVKVASQLQNVTMTGWLNSTDIHAILQKTKVGLAAYSKEALMSLPNKPFEYMAASLPLLSSLPGELAELIKEHNIGRNYIAGDPVSLAREIQWFYDHPEETSRMGQKAFDLFSKRFRSDIVYNEFSEYLERIVKQHNGKR